MSMSERYDVLIGLTLAGLICWQPVWVLGILTVAGLALLFCAFVVALRMPSEDLSPTRRAES
jgi:hypothetical protein